jgi:hypothetical protein
LIGVLKEAALSRKALHLSYGSSANYGLPVIIIPALLDSAKKISTQITTKLKEVQSIRSVTDRIIRILILVCIVGVL